MAQFGAFSACRESFIPLWLAQHQAGRILYRMRGRVGASHDSTTRPTSAEDTRGVAGPGRGAGCGRLAGPARVRRATTTQISHIISHGHFSRRYENVAIPMMSIQCLNKLRGNYVRNYYGGGRTRPGLKTTYPHAQHRRHHWCGGHRRDRRAQAGGPGRGTRGRRRSLASLRGDVQAHISDTAPPVWRAPEGPEGLAAAPVGGGGAWPVFETTRRATQSSPAPQVWRAPEGP